MQTALAISATQLVTHQPRTKKRHVASASHCYSTTIHGCIRGSPSRHAQNVTAAAAAAANADAATDVAFVSDDAARRGDAARAWISCLYDAVDYEAAMEAAAALEAEVGSSLEDQRDEDEELMYGEFDMGFFLALLESLEDRLAAREAKKKKNGGGAFVDVGSGRGQLAVLAAAARPTGWSRCVGLEYMPILHAIAEQVKGGVEGGVGVAAATMKGMEEDEREAVYAALPKIDDVSPLKFVRGDMYDDGDMGRALDGASLVFMFSTRFGVVEDDGEGEGEGGAVLKVSSHVRRHVEAGTLIVTVNNVLSEADGFRLVRRVEGPDSERTGGSEAYIWEAVA